MTSNHCIIQHATLSVLTVSLKKQKKIFKDEHYYNRILVLLSLLSLLSTSEASKNVVENKPSVIFLMCDSMDGRVMDPSSEIFRSVEMKNLRALASKGVNFVNTYAASPQCVPSRTTMFSRRHIHHSKTWSNSQGFAGDADWKDLDPKCLQYYGQDQCEDFAQQQNLSSTIVDMLDEAKCEACLFGKVDVGAGIIESPRFPNSAADGWHNGPALGITGRSSDIRQPTKPDPLQITNDTDNFVHQEDWKTVSKCVEWLENRDTDDDDSFFLYCSLNIPHPAFDTNATWLSYVNDTNVRVPQWLPREKFHPADSYMSQSKNVWRDFTDDEILKVRKTYYGMCAETDYLLGRVIDAAERTGHTLENTYFVFVSDHGEMNMEHRQVWKNSMYEASSRVPMIIAGPNVRENVVVENLTKRCSVKTHILRLLMVGGSKPEWLDGETLFPFLFEGDENSVSSSGRYVVSQYHSNMGNTGSFMIRDGPYKYITFGTTLSTFKEYRPQLFNVENDPDELDDLLPDSSNEDALRIAKELDVKLRSVVDYPSVDREAIRNDAKTCTKILSTQRHKTQNLWKSAYTGFSDDDWSKVQSWQEEILSLL